MNIGAHYQVLDIFEEDKVAISQLQPDASIQYSFTCRDLIWNLNPVHGVIFVQAPQSLNKEIHQAIYVD